MKKFLIILLAFFLLIPKTFAYVNIETSYNITINELAVMNQTFGENTLKEIIDSVNTIETNKFYSIHLSFRYDTSTQIYNVSGLNIKIFDSIPLVHFRSYFNNSKHYFYLFSSFDFSGTSYYSKSYTSSSIKNMYATLYPCLHDNDCSSLTSLTTVYDSYITFASGYTVTNTDSYNYSIPDDHFVTNLLIYSNFNYVYEIPSSDTSTTRLYKKLYINNNEIIDGSSIPSYYDLYYSSNPEPDDPDEPVNPDDPDEPTSSDFTSWIYWFSEPSDSISVLNNIYTLLFLYCITMLILKTYYIIKVKK